MSLQCICLGSFLTLSHIFLKQIQHPILSDMLLNKDTLSAIKSRQEGKDTLSWIERFGLHLFEENCNPKITFNKKEESEVLVLRVNKREKAINVYHCFFKTDENGFVRFCVNNADDSNATSLIKLMDGAKWDDPSTINWWKEAFCNGEMYKVDEDTLKREITQTSEYEKMNLMKFIERIQDEIGKAVSKLDIKREKIKRVFLVEQYALALPMKYAVGRIFPNAIGSVFGFIWKYSEEEEKLWTQNATRFHVPEELHHIALNTSPKMTVGDVVKMGEDGAVFTLPLTKDESGNCFLPTTPIFADSELKWNEITKGDVNADYSVGNMSFKRVRLSVFADGFQKIYVKNGSDVVACFPCEKENDEYRIMSHYPDKSEEDQKPSISKIKTGKEYHDGEMALQTTIEKDKSIDDSDKSVPKEDLYQEYQDANNTTNAKDQSIASSIELEEIADKIVFYIHQGVKRTAKSLETIARDFILNKFNEEIPLNASDSEKEVFWKKKYEDCLSQDWQKTMLSNWQKFKQIEYGNFYRFLRFYQYKGLSRCLKGPKFSIIDSSVAALKSIRNLNAHAANEKILGIGRTKILFSFEHMTSIAEQLKDEELLDILEKYKSEIENEWDENFTNYLKSKSQS